MAVDSVLVLVCLAVGVIVCIAGALWLIIEAFRTHVAWGLLCLLLPPVQLVFLIVNWTVAWRPFLLGLLGSVVIVLGGIAANTESKDGVVVPAAIASLVAIETFEAETDQSDGAENEDAGPTRPAPGTSAADVRATWGKPAGHIKSGGELILIYPEFTVVCGDGETVSKVVVTERK